MISRLVIAFLSLLTLAGVVRAEPRFPPPEFESGHTLPSTSYPSPRAIPMAYLDAALLVGCLGLAAYLVLKKRSRRGVVALSVFSLAYFGFYRQGCVCAIGSVQNVSLALFDHHYAIPITILIFFVAPVLMALLAGRMFCAAVCPHGALQELVLVKPIRIPRWLEEGLGLVPFLYLGAAILFAATGSAFIICRYDPFVSIFRLSGSFGLLLFGGGLLLIGMFVGRPYCRFLCPYGALLKLTSKLSKWRVRITPNQCTQCRLCEDACPYGTIRWPSVPPREPRAISLEKRQLAKTLVLWPLLIVLCGWAGSKFSLAASSVHPAVDLAQRYLLQQSQPDSPSGAARPVDLDLAKRPQQPDVLLANARDIRHRFQIGGWWFGSWIGLIVGAKLLGLSMWRSRRDYEPDRGDCLACARCFESCPNEQIRRGGLPAAAPFCAKAASPAEPRVVTTPS